MSECACWHASACFLDPPTHCTDAYFCISYGGERCAHNGLWGVIERQNVVGLLRDALRLQRIHLQLKQRFVGLLPQKELA